MELFSFLRPVAGNRLQSKASAQGKGLLLSAAVLAAVASGAHAQQVGDIFYIALENHDFTQPTSYNGTEPIFGNPNAPFIDSLLTPGNPNAAQVSYETNYTQPGNGDHPSEPNYVWAEQGSNFNPTTPNAAGGGVSTAGGPTSTTQGTINGTTILNDNDPSASSGNIFPTSYAANHLTGQLNAAGITWKNYQEDYQYSSSVLVSASGTGGVHNGNTVVANPYNGSLEYNYAVKHNPMAFFADTATQNVEQISQLQSDLNNNTVGRYNWITPDQYNDMHSTLSGNYAFTYNGITYDSANGNNNDSEQIAQGDNFLSIIIPEIEASQAYKNNGAIVIWNDETEGGDTSAFTSTEIVISPLAKGNAYASSVPTDHSSDIKTWEELFGLPFINNPIPSSETLDAVTGQYAAVPTSNDLSDLFVPGAIVPVPEPATFGVLALSGLTLLARRRRTA
jgi:phosphatidylinositol-3-phosphatase